MSVRPANRIDAIKPSATLAVSAKAAALKAQGRDIINLSVGEPDFDTPEHIKAAAILAIQKGFTKYTAVGGTPSLKQAIVNKLERDNTLRYKASQILVSCGAKQSFYNLAQALLNDGDEVIIPEPYWVSYPEIVLLAGAQPVFVPTTLSARFKITPEALEAAITPKSRLLIINSPSNPSGMAYSKAELAALGEVLKRHPEIFIASDDMYEHILWQQKPFANILNACPELYDRTIVINGVSKAYAMTGWRIGYAAGPEWLITAMTTVQSQSTSNPSSISQYAAQAALEQEQTCVLEMVEVFKKRHDCAVELLNKIPGVNCLEADGTFYLFPYVGEIAERFNGDVGLCDYWLEKASAALVPGAAFGAPGYVRLSIALDDNSLVRALTQMKACIE